MATCYSCGNEIGEPTTNCPLCCSWSDPKGQDTLHKNHSPIDSRNTIHFDLLPAPGKPSHSTVRKDMVSFSSRLFSGIGKVLIAALVLIGLADLVAILGPVGAIIGIFVILHFITKHIEERNKQRS